MLVVLFNNSLIIQWIHPASNSDIVTGTYPITFPTSVLFVFIKGNFQSWASGGTTYNDLSMYSGFISTLDLSTFTYRCAATNPYCLFIGC